MVPDQSKTCLGLEYFCFVRDGGYASALETIRGLLKQLGNLQLVGRNRMHKHNNQDHSMLTAMLAVQNILGQHDLWIVNVEQEYHDKIKTGGGQGSDWIAEFAATQPRVPTRKE